jgi:hypothetical protein
VGALRVSRTGRAVLSLLTAWFRLACTVVAVAEPQPEHDLVDPLPAE